MDRAEARLTARADAEGSVEATRCFLRAMLVGIDEDGAVPDDLVARIADLLKIERDELFGPPPGSTGAASTRRLSTRPPSVGPRRRRILVLGRADAARLPMLEAIVRAAFAEEADVRGAALSPAPLDPRALRVLRLAGYATDALVPRALAVEDMTWSDLVVTVSGEREDWERLLPRNLEHVHDLIDDPAALARDLEEVDDQSEPYRATLRAIERLVEKLRGGRSTRMPVPDRRASSSSLRLGLSSGRSSGSTPPPPGTGAQSTAAPPLRPALSRRPTPPPQRPSQQMPAVRPSRASQTFTAVKPDEPGSRGGS